MSTSVDSIKNMITDQPQHVEDDQAISQSVTETHEVILSATTSIANLATLTNQFISSENLLYTDPISPSQANISTNSMLPSTNSPPKQRVAKCTKQNSDNGDTTEAESTQSSVEEPEEHSYAKDKLTKLEAESLSLSSRINILEKVVVDFGDLFTNLAKLVDQLQTNATTQPKPLFTSLLDSPETASPHQPTPEERNIIHAVRVEQLNCNSRENNILLMGVVSPSDDLDQKTKLNIDKKNINDILNTVGLKSTSIKSFYRFKKTPNSIHQPIIKVELYNKDDVSYCIKESWKLKGLTGPSKIYINRDLTPIMRQAEKILITKRNDLNKQRPSDCTYYYGIRNGTLKKINNLRQRAQ